MSLVHQNWWFTTLLIKQFKYCPPLNNSRPGHHRCYNCYDFNIAARGLFDRATQTSNAGE